MQAGGDPSCSSGWRRVAIAVELGRIARGWHDENVDGRLVHRRQIGGAHFRLVRLELVDNGIVCGRGRIPQRLQTIFMQRMELAGRDKLLDGLWVSRPGGDEIALQGGAHFAFRVRARWMLGKLRNFEGIDDLGSHRAQIGDGLFDKRGHGGVGSAGRKSLPQYAYAFAARAVGAQKIHIAGGRAPSDSRRARVGRVFAGDDVKGFCQVRQGPRHRTRGIAIGIQADHARARHQSPTWSQAGQRVVGGRIAD